MKNILKYTVAFLLEQEARAVLRKYKPKIVAITGTVGKTSTKDAVATVLSRFYSVRKSPKSFNSEIGVPLTILGVPNAGSNIFGWLKNLIEGLGLIFLPNHYPEWLVLEIGADTPGDIARVTKWVVPDIVVVTKLSKVPVHVEFFPTPEDLFKEKGHLVTALKAGGTLILNADDEDVLAYRELTKDKILLVGNANDADIRAKDDEIVYDENDLPKGITFEVEVSSTKEVLPVYLSGTLGAHHAYHVLAALAVCAALGEHLSVAAKAFKHHEPTPGRMRLIEGIKQSIILDDSYNSSPVALEEALNSLESLSKAKRKIAVLGDMLELGKYSVDEHKKAGERAAKVADIIITVGVRSRYISEGARDAGMDEKNIFQFDDSKEAADFLPTIIEPGDAILIKGSQGVRMERVVLATMLHPEDKEKLLVRQDKEWKNK